MYVNNVASGSPVTITAVGNADNSLNFYVNNTLCGGPIAITVAGSLDTTNNFYLARLASNYGDIKLRNVLFAKKVWTQAERDKIWATWRGIFSL